MGGVMVVALSPEGAFDRGYRLLSEAVCAAKEVVNAARAVGVAGYSLSAGVVGKDTDQVAGYLSSCGIEKVYAAGDNLLGEFQADIYLASLETVVREARPDFIVFDGTGHSRDVAPRLAARLGASLVTDVVAVEGGDGAVRFTRPVYGGKALAVMEPRRQPVVISIRQHAFRGEGLAQGGAEARADVIRLRTDMNPVLLRTRIVERRGEGEAGPGLEEARVVIGGGRGVGGPEGFRLLEKLARVLGGAVGASRAAVDAGWVPAHLQIGQTGRVIAPDLYIAVGISGASQHLAGVAGAKHIIAINRDREAPIFQVAEIGLVDDFRRVLPVLIEKLEQRVSV